MKEDIDTLKDDWLTDNVGCDMNLPRERSRLILWQSISFWEEYVPSSAYLPPNDF